MNNYEVYHQIAELHSGNSCNIAHPMGTKEKLIERFKTLPKDFTWDETKRMLTSLGYIMRNKGKTSGSRIIFTCDNRRPLMLHRPHPGNILKEYTLKQIFDVLKEENLI